MLCMEHIFHKVPWIVPLDNLLRELYMGVLSMVEGGGGGGGLYTVV